MVELSVRTVRYALRAPLRASWGELHERETLRVRLEFPDGLYGEGEAAPLEPFDGVSLASVSAAIDAYKAVLAEIEPTADVLAACRAERDLPQALAAIDMALWDHASRRTQTPLAKLIHPLAADEVAVNATIGADDRAGASEAAAQAVRDGFRCVKVKVGIGDDAGRLAAVRAAVGPDVLIRVDANGAWQTPDEALANLRALAPVGLELCEEPVHGVDALRAVAAESPVRIAMDETHAPGSGAAELVCLKISRGGISAVLEDARKARAAGSSVYLTSTFDGPLGIAAGVHTAAGLRISRACGLATLQSFAEPTGAPEPRGGSIAVPSVPGLA
jgi:L-alanine-DL-glutamate epimerase-like enolase superfamily enzyme